MPISQRQLAVSVFAAHHIADRGVIAAFIADPATQAAPNPFAETSAGAVRQVWRQRVAEFQSFNIEMVGLPCLLRTLSTMGVDEVLVQEILRAGPHTANVFHGGDGCRIVGAVLYGKPGVDLPFIPRFRSRRGTSSSFTGGPTIPKQLDLFAYIST